MLTPLIPLVKILGCVAGVSTDDSGEYMWHGLHAGEKGMFRRDSRGEDIGEKKMFTSEEVLERVWEHSLEETEERK